jgi:hypothetical protein
MLVVFVVAAAVGKFWGGEVERWRGGEEVGGKKCQRTCQRTRTITTFAKQKNSKN